MTGFCSTFQGQISQMQKKKYFLYYCKNMEPSKKLLGSVTIIPEIVADIKKNVQNIADFTKEIQEHIKQNTTNLLDVILCAAIQLTASDIHLEPEEEKIRLRIRIDGVLQDAVNSNAQAYFFFFGFEVNVRGRKLNGCA